MKDASKMVKDVIEELMNLGGIATSVNVSQSGQKMVVHISPVATSFDSDSDRVGEFKRVDRKKRKPSPTPTPSPNNSRTQRKKQQAIRETNGPKKKVTPKKKPEPKALDTLTPEELINEITQDGNLSNVNKLYHSFKDSDKDTIEESIILYLHIYKKVLIKVVDDLPNDLYLRLEAKRMSFMELDMKLKVEALLSVHLVNSKQEIDDLISEANRIIFVSGHRQVSLLAGRVKEITYETTNKWDMFFVEREKKEEKDREKMDKSFTKLYQKDEGEGKIGSVPDIIIKDNLSPLAQDTPPIIVEASTQTKSHPDKEKVEEITKDDTNPESDILFTMNVDTQEFNIVLDKETTEVKKAKTTNIEIFESPVNTIDSQQNIEILAEVKKPETIPDDTLLNIEIPTEAQAKAHEQSVAELVVNKANSKDENKVEKQSQHKEETVNKEEVKDGNKIVEIVQES